VNQGKFLYAQECFERCLRDGDPSYRHIQFHLVDIYCQLGCAELAKDLLLDDVERLRHTQSQQLKVFRRLVLPITEVHINLRQLNAARYTLEEVLQVYKSMKHLDVTDKLGHVRTMISLARVDWYRGMYSDADERLKRVTALVESYSTFITLFHSVVKRALDSDILSKVSRGYFMAGNGTYCLKEISSSA
jgi:tetratricopeptide (TPR) repeat protein